MCRVVIFLMSRSRSRVCRLEVKNDNVKRFEEFLHKSQLACGAIAFHTRKSRSNIKRFISLSLKKPMNDKLTHDNLSSHCKNNTQIFFLSHDQRQQIKRQVERKNVNKFLESGACTTTHDSQQHMFWHFHWEIYKSTKIIIVDWLSVIKSPIFVCVWEVIKNETKYPPKKN